MADDLYEILVNVDGNARQEVEGTADGFRRLNLAIDTVNDTLQLTNQVFSAVAQAGQVTYDVLIRKNQELQETIIATQTALASTQDVLVGGVIVEDPRAAIEALSGVVTQSIERIREATLGLSGVTSEEVIPIFQGVTQQAANLNLSLENSEQLAISFAAGLSAFNIPLREQRQEIQSILTATIDTNSVLAKNLGITNEQIRAAREQGTVFQFLEERLSAAVAGQAIAAETIGGVFSNVLEFVQEIQRIAGEPLLEPLTEALTGILDFLAPEGEGGRRLADNLRQTALAIGQGLATVFESLLTTLQRVSEILQPVIASFGELFVGFDLQNQLAAIGLSVELLAEGLAIILQTIKNLIPVGRAFLAVYTVGLSELVFLTNQLLLGLTELEVRARSQEDALDNFTDAVNKLREGIPLTTTELERLEQQLQSAFTGAEADRALRTVRELQEAAEQTAASIQLQARAQEDATQSAAELAREQRALAQEAERQARDREARLQTSEELFTQGQEARSQALEENARAQQDENQLLGDFAGLLGRTGDLLDDENTTARERNQLLLVQRNLLEELAALGVQVESQRGTQLSREQILLNVERARLEIQKQQLAITREQTILNAQRQQTEALVSFRRATAEGDVAGQQLARLELASIPQQLANALRQVDFQGLLLDLSSQISDIEAGRTPTTGGRGAEGPTRQAALQEANQLLAQAAQPIADLPGVVQNSNQQLGEAFARAAQGQTTAVVQEIRSVVTQLNQLPAAVGAAVARSLPRSAPSGRRSDD